MTTPGASGATAVNAGDAAIEAAVAYWFNWSEGLRKAHAHPTATDHVAYLAFLNSLDDDGFAVALAYFDRNGGSQRDTETTGYLMDWAKKNPAAALAYAETFAWSPPTANGGVDDRTTTLSLLLQDWAKSDPSGVLAWIQQQPGGPDRAQLAQMLAGQLADPTAEMALISLGADPQSVFSSLAKQDPNAAFNEALGLPEGPDRQAAMTAIFQQADAATALSLANNLANADERAAAFKDLAIRTDQDPATALSLAANIAGAGEKTSAIESILQRMEPAQAFSYISNLPSSTDAASTEQQQIAAGVLIRLARVNTAEASATASAWLQSLPAGSDLQQSAITNYADALAGQNPAAAVQWVGAINDQPSRDRVTTEIAQTWLKADAPAAASWLSQTSLPDSAKQQILAKASGG